MFTTAFLDLPPLERVAGTVRLPGSKSISNRLLLLAGLSEGCTRVLDLLDSDDTRVMLEALAQLGCGIARTGPTEVSITGFSDGAPSINWAELFLGNAGTAMRPLAAALAVTGLGRDIDYTLSGVARMHERPIGDLVDALRQLGCRIDYLQTPGYPPLRIRRGEARSGAFPAAPLRVRGDVSSQFLTALLMALPMRSGNGDIVIEVDGELISKPYIDITLNLLERFGIAVRREGWSRFTIPEGSVYRSPGEIHVEGDASSASYFIAMGAIAAVDAPIVVEGVGAGSIQGDMRFVEAAQAMGADVRTSANRVEIRRGAWPLSAVDIDCNHIPDAAMTLAAMALFARGRTRLRGIGSWRVKETDRIAAMATELRKLGATVDEGPDWIAVEAPTAWRAAAIHTYDDHRMAMCFSLAAFNPLATDTPVPVRILDPRCVGKTFPDYFEALFGVAAASDDAIPVITVDGPTASGKGTLASMLAAALGYHHLDSGALYRCVALDSIEHGIDADDEPGLAALARSLQVEFRDNHVWLGGRDVTDDLRHEDVGVRASQVSAWPAVRRALHDLQVRSRLLPGLVADGRDMGTVIFPSATLKVFLTASAATRAERRHKQLISKGFSSSIQRLRADLEARDARDQSRNVSPLKPARDAMLLDNSALSIEQSVEQVLDGWQQRRPFG
jgi:3-phosphoshikimate 1-carboxyvinyltransferase